MRNNILLMSLILALNLYPSGRALAQNSGFDIKAKFVGTSYLLPEYIYMTYPFSVTASELLFGASSNDTKPYTYTKIFKIVPKALGGTNDSVTFRTEDLMYRDVYPELSEYSGSLTENGRNIAIATVNKEQITIPGFKPYNQDFVKYRYDTKNFTYDAVLSDFPIVKINLRFGTCGSQICGCIVGYLTGYGEWSQNGHSIFASSYYYGNRLYDYSQLLSYDSFGYDVTYQSKVALKVFSSKVLGLPAYSMQTPSTVVPLPRVGQIRFLNLTQNKHAQRIAQNIENGVLKQTAYKLDEDDWYNDLATNRIDLYEVSASEIKAEQNKNGGFSLCDVLK